MRLFILAMAFLFTITPASLAADPTKDIVIKVNGMVCDFCAQSLKKVFGKEDSVNDIVVNLDDQTVTVDTKDGATLSDEKIKELIEWGGYDLVSIDRSPS
jgi:copper chaperone CopZ